MNNREQDKIWWEKQKNEGWKVLTAPLSQDSAIHSRFNNFIKKFYWQFRQKKGIPRGSYSPEINFQGFKEFIISEKKLGYCSWERTTQTERDAGGERKIYYTTISIFINQLYLLNKLGMERLIVSNPDVSPGGTYEYKEIHFDELIKTIAHELAHAYQFTINSKIEGEKSSCESSGKKDANGIFLYPALVAEHTQLTEEIKQIITSSPYYQEFKAWWNNQQPTPEIPEEEEDNKKCKNCGSENTFGFDYCFECRQEKKELEDLIVWLENSQNLASLEKNYQEIKKKSLYDANKKTLDKNQNNKELIDNYYAKKMIDLKFPNSDASNFNYGLWIFMVILAIFFLTALYYFCQAKAPKTKKR